MGPEVSGGYWVPRKHSQDWRVSGRDLGVGSFECWLLSSVSSRLPHCKNNTAWQGEALREFYLPLVAWNRCITAVLGLSEKLWEAWWWCWLLSSKLGHGGSGGLANVWSRNHNTTCYILVHLKAKIWEDESWFPVKHNCQEEGTTVTEWTTEKAPSCELLVPSQMVWRNFWALLKRVRP